MLEEARQLLVRMCYTYPKSLFVQEANVDRTDSKSPRLIASILDIEASRP